ncbi:predicted protein [Chaetoceros tenuissimus]|uniref:Uncharacterized protein n=1 Tax=Chaetoceros tenuissimus TaxID=426638 RepID=A0AAD3HG09_9STRA|nr:predicted protein [Chaetoceros tenuissimus]
MATYTDYAGHTDVFVKRTGPGRKGLVFPVKLFLVLKYIDLKEPHLKTINREENGSYYHEKFLRSKDYLCRLIQRNEASRSIPDIKEPVFERMKAMPPSEQHRLTTPESDDELFDLLFSSSSNKDTSSRSSNQSSSVVALATSGSFTDVNPSINSSHVPLSTCTTNQEATVPINPLLLQTFDARNTNQSETDNNGQTYDNLDLEQLLSDENESQWRHLQPFPTGFQPPLSQGESEEMEQFMDFVRSKTRRKKDTAGQ